MSNLRYRIRCDLRYRTYDWQEQYFDLRYDLRCRTLHYIIYNIVVFRYDIVHDIVYDMALETSHTMSYIIYDVRVQYRIRHRIRYRI